MRDKEHYCQECLSYSKRKLTQQGWLCDYCINKNDVLEANNRAGKKRIIRLIKGRLKGLELYLSHIPADKIITPFDIDVRTEFYRLEAELKQFGANK
jgi:hypothetical protein